MESLRRWLVLRSLRSVSAQITRTESELELERGRAFGLAESAAEAAGDHLSAGNGSTRDEAFRARRTADSAQHRVEQLAVQARQLRTRRDALLDELSSLADGGHQ